MKTKKIGLILFCFALLFVLSCIDAINPPIRDQSEKLVVDGMITNLPPPYTILLSKSVIYENLGSLTPKPLSGARVTIIEDTGKREVLREESQGRYRSSPTGIRGQIGRSYQVEIVLPDQRKFVSVPDKMPAVSAIDSISSEFSVKSKGHFFYVNTRDPKKERNYYRWTAYSIGANAVDPEPPPPPAAGCRSLCWQYYENRGINILSDEFIDGNPIQRQQVAFAPFRSRAELYVEINQLSLSQDAFKFWQLLSDQRNRSGSIFDPPPAPINGNIYNVNDPKEYALGYFSASAIDRRRFVLQRDNILEGLFPPRVYIGRCCEPYTNSSQIRPDWKD